MKKYILFLVPVLVIFYSCSKDDNPEIDNNPESTSSKSGVFIDSPVEGLKYETETHSGFTDENGSYDYEVGETVTFYIGEIKLGSAVASDELSPISISSDPDATLETTEVQNIAAFLQTLDKDGNPANGILIDEEIINSISFSEIDFTKPIIQILGEITLEVFQNTGINLNVVFPEVATVHLAQTLGLEFEPTDKFLNNFLPIFTNYNSQRSKAIHWIHEFDDQNRLISSTKYEKYPFRVESIYTFHDYDETNLSVKYEVNGSAKYKLYYDDNFVFIMLERLEADLISFPYDVFTEINEDKQITKVNSLDRDQNFVASYKYTFNSRGLNIHTEKYDADNILTLTTTSEYTSFGDISGHENIAKNGELESKWEYFYREDKTLEHSKIFIYGDSSLQIVNFTDYDENENIIKVIFEEGVTKDIRYYENDILISEEIYQEGLLTEIYYFEPEGSVIKREIYDSSGNLIDTICYNYGMEIECPPA